MGCSESSEKKEDKKEFDAPHMDKSRDDSRAAEEPEEIHDMSDEEDDDENVGAAGGMRGNGKWVGDGPKDINGMPITEDDAKFSNVFKSGGAVLMRIVQKDDLWSFYNDTQEFEMHITWKFGPDSKINPCSPETKFERDAENWIVATMVVYPNETKEFIRGKYNGYKSSASAKPLSAEYRAKLNAAANEKVQGELKNIRKLAGRDAELNENAPRILESCVSQSVMYVDLNFPPDDSSLSRPGIDKRALPSQAWKRPIDYLRPEDHDKIRCIKKAEPDDIDQGQLGDCWFLCAVASLAEFPDKVKDVFRHPSIDADHRRKEEKLGAYHVTLNKHGWWQVYIVDDYLPCIGDKPCYAKCVEDPSELWVSLLEKAYAKAHGSYASIAGGDALHALQDLTGYPINRFDTEWEDALKDQAASVELFTDLAAYDKENYLINLNTPGQDNSAYMGAVQAGNSRDFEEKYKKAGLGMGHAYSVLTVKDFPSYSGGGGHLRLLQIRNPWGNGTEWTGAWCDEDPRWKNHPDVAQECQFVNATDGTFWMEWEDAKEYFDGGGVCFMKTNWFDYRIAGAFHTGFPNCVLEIRCTKKVNAYVIVSQKDKRGLPNDDPNKDYAAMLLSVSKGIVGANGAPRQQVHLNSSSDADKPTTQFTFNYARDLALLYTFEPSEHPYVVIPRMYDSKDHGRTKDYVLGLISDCAVDQDSFQVSFKTLDKTSKVFANYPKFDYNDEKATEFTTQFQYNPEVGCPVTLTGSALREK